MQAIPGSTVLMKLARMSWACPAGGAVAAFGVGLTIWASRLRLPGHRAEALLPQVQQDESPPREFS